MSLERRIKRLREERNSALAVVRRLQDERRGYLDRVKAMLESSSDSSAQRILDAVRGTLPERFAPEDDAELPEALNRWAEERQESHEAIMTKINSIREERDSLASTIQYAIEGLETGLGHVMGVAKS